MEENIPFSEELEQWLHSKQPKTLQTLTQAVAEKSFALIFLVFMSIPALPLPTGGIVLLFELLTMLVALQLVIGRRTIWLPARWGKIHLNRTLRVRTLPYLIARIRWFEKYSRPRLSGLLSQRDFLRIVGLLVFIFALASSLAPPFSGLDTVPALAAMGIALALILEDFIILVLGVILGVIGILLEVLLATAAINLFHVFYS